MELVDDSSNPNKLTAPNISQPLDGRWPSSRIVRVSRGSGGKDRHSKVVTSKGLRDRRIRLSVSTAIEFYDLQDRLGFDQPSKAVEWLINAASTSIAELPSLHLPFSTEKDHSNQQQLNNNNNNNNDNNNGSVSKSCSSTSETSKGSGVSLSRSENRIRARERARGMAANKEKKKKETYVVNGGNNGSQNSSFTDLLTGGMINNQMEYFQYYNYNQLGHTQYSYVRENSGPVEGGGLGRGTLQSNLLCFLGQNDQNLQRFQTSSMVDGENFQFFTAPATDGLPGSEYDAQCLQLYGGSRGNNGAKDIHLRR